MAGLLDQAAQGAPPAAADPSMAPPPAAPGQGGDEEGEQPNVTPEEQAAYDQAMKNGLALIYDGSKVRPGILKALQAGVVGKAPAPQGGPAPAEASGQPDESDAGVAPGADEPDPPGQTQASGQDDPKLGEKMALAHTAVTIVSQLDDSSEQAGQPIPDEVLVHVGQAIVEELGEVMDAAKIGDLTDEDVTGAFYLALDMYREKAKQDGRTDDATLKDQFGQIQQADQQGKLGELLPGLGGQGGAQAAPAPAAPQPQGAM